MIVYTYKEISKAVEGGEDPNRRVRLLRQNRPSQLVLVPDPNQRSVQQKKAHGGHHDYVTGGPYDKEDRAAHRAGCEP